MLLCPDLHESVRTSWVCPIWSQSRTFTCIRPGKKERTLALVLMIAPLSALTPGCSRANSIDNTLITVSPADGELDQLAISVAKHCGVTLVRYRCAYKGSPVQLRVWWEVAGAGQQPTKFGLVHIERDKRRMPKMLEYDDFLYVWSDPLREHLSSGVANPTVPLVASWSVASQTLERATLRLTIECDGQTRLRTIELPRTLAANPGSSGGYLAGGTGEVLSLYSCSFGGRLSGRDAHDDSDHSDDSRKITLTLKIVAESVGTGWPPSARNN